jgi:hypothetical protein
MKNKSSLMTTAEKAGLLNRHQNLNLLGSSWLEVNIANSFETD